MLLYKIFNKTIFVKSISNIKNEKLNFGLEIAFIGYSNSGKSSVINALINRKNLARVSKIPGRTQLINVFELFNGVRLMDLPGYGYTKISQLISLKWKKMVFKYLQIRTCLKGLVLVIDIRRCIRIIDQKVIKIALNNNIPIIILLNKSDKIASYKRNFILDSIKRETQFLSNKIDVMLFSAVKKTNLNQLQNIINNWTTII